jgi:hypothetical protein
MFRPASQGPLQQSLIEPPIFDIPVRNKAPSLGGNLKRKAATTSATNLMMLFEVDVSRAVGTRRLIMESRW